MNINPKIKGHAGFGMAFSVSSQSGVKSSFKSPCTLMCGPQTSETGNFRQIGFCSGVRNDESYTFLDTASQRGMTEGVPPHPDAGSTNKRVGKFSAIGIPLRCVERRALPFLGYRVAARYDRGCHPAPRCGVHKQASREILGNRDSASSAN